MKVSEITLQEITEFARLDEPTEIEKKELQSMMEEAKSYIKNYTGLSDEEVDQYEDLTVVFKILVLEWFDNRNYYTEKNHIENRTVSTILNMHCKNLL